MITFLFLLCFILIGILFFCLLLISQKINHLKEMEKTQGKILRDIEEAFAGFIMQIKEENEQLVKKAQDDQEIQNNQVNQGNQGNQVNSDSPSVSEKRSFSLVEQQLTDDDFKDLLPLYTEIEHTPQKQAAEKEVVVIPPPTSEQQLLDKVISMKEQGAGIEEIAKKLNRGKTEIELLLKFRQK
ncbi:hypothetical protein [Bacillus sp. PS06]|uniref:hypothetical protein n=1 Tax=Bacillus sp. PS06 TaxID=2764176 RepID=UPI00178261B3|nr:hypothetical protein [Bacillus sp. PS06]MBD8068273.1 hypothetical protein [Bacillus sp. PS06]